MSSRGPSPLRPPTTPFKVDQAMEPLDAGLHPVFHAGRVAVITGAANGIGRAAARELAKLGLKIAIADYDEAGLTALEAELKKDWGEASVIAQLTDVSNIADVLRLRDRVYDTWGEVAVLMNNAGVSGIDASGVRGTSWTGLESWKKVVDVNIFGYATRPTATLARLTSRSVVNMQQTFIPYMLPQENQSVIINTGSKQGITNPPGNTAYNASKAAVKSLTEGLSHELRSQPHSNITAHLFMRNTTDNNAVKPPGAWTAEETVLFMLDRVRSGDFYILVPDNETRREVDNLRIMWSAGDITEGRPPLSRWHPNYKAIFEDYMRENLAQMD
ncbi:NAD-P-binding protein [Vararia minispora EC-137]|uniref:NAD-P-binding protein n=1 Tax=Vararia minispora EC-137 TaxID=1314806 RepID=A0ACB8QTK7_9AGAM|nr:NAD-P-binding protein [Vararia minispora EC-137]